MILMDLFIAAVYAVAILKTQRKELIYCFVAHVFCLCFSFLVVDLFSVYKNGIECLYFLFLSAAWIYASSKVKDKNRCCCVMLLMAIFQLICGIESFIWQFITPVLTPVIKYYEANVIFLHLIILTYIINKGVKIERSDFINNNNILHNFYYSNVARYYRGNKK